MESMTNEALLSEVRRRLLGTVDVVKVIVFGSRARGDAKPDSDLDLIVVVRAGGSPGERGVPVRRALRDLDVAKDVLVYTVEEYERYRTYPSSVVHAAEREGVVLHG
jgi:predicted nucleotidyltransferase